MGSAPSLPAELSLSVVIPVYNEAENVALLIESVHEVLRSLPHAFELIVVDDGSDDGTDRVLRTQVARVPQLVCLRLRRNFGQTAALQAGFDRARGDVVVTMDGDLQNDPRDIPLLLRELARGADVVSGWRRQRRDKFLIRRLPSAVANWMIRRVTGVPVHDQGCSLKAYRHEVIEQLDLYSDMHRFITVLAMVSAPRIAEVEVRHHARVAGVSKYGLSRVGKVIADLLTIQMLTRFRDRPVRWFTLLGLPFAVLALLALLAAPLVGGIVMVTTAIVLGLVCVSCLLAGAVAQTVLETADRPPEPLICRELSVT